MAYLSLDEFKLWQGIDRTETDDDTLLLSLLDRVTTAIETYLGIQLPV